MSNTKNTNNLLSTETQFKYAIGEKIYTVVNITPKSVVYNKEGWKKPSYMKIDNFLSDVESGKIVVIEVTLPVVVEVAEVKITKKINQTKKIDLSTMIYAIGVDTCEVSNTYENLYYARIGARQLAKTSTKNILIWILKTANGEFVKMIDTVLAKGKVAFSRIEEIN